MEFLTRQTFADIVTCPYCFLGEDTKTLSTYISTLKVLGIVSYVGNIWIGPWANFPQYLDRTFGKWSFYALFRTRLMSPNI